MATGFVNRWKGKIAGAAAYWGGVQTFGVGTVFAASTASAALQAIPAQNGIATIAASSGASVFTLGALPAAGAILGLVLTVSSAAFVKAAAGSAFDASTNNVFKSTYNQQVTLRGLSTARWAIQSVYPDTTAGGAPVGGITLSTTT